MAGLQKDTGSSKNLLSEGLKSTESMERLLPGMANEASAVGRHGSVTAIESLGRKAPTPLGTEKRAMLLSSQWTIHVGPCLLAAPPGGHEANVQLMSVTPCRVAVHPGEREHRGSTVSVAGLRTGQDHLDYETMVPLLTWPHEVRPIVATHVMKRLIPNTYLPGERILDTTNSTGQLVMVLHGSVVCGLDDANKGREGVEARNSSSLDTCGPGAPFDRVPSQGAHVVAMPPGGVLGEWQQLQSEVSPAPRLTASTNVATLTLSDEVLTAAMQWDDNVEGNLWWWHAARGAYFLLREREPFAGWQPSKLWRWLQTGTHVRVARDHGELIGADSSFVMLIHGSCRAVPTQMPSARGEDLKQDSRKPQEGRRGSGGLGLGLLPMRASCQAGRDAAAMPAKRVYNGPDLIVASSDNSYLFKHDSLVFVPSAESANWLPANWQFPMAKAVLGNGKAMPPPRPPVVDLAPAMAEENPLAA